MDNKLKETELIERYVLHQLNEEELALFRGRLMFDEKLRKQVVETKMLMNNLQKIATTGKFGAPTKTATAKASIATASWNRRRLLSVAAMAAGIILIAVVAINQNTATIEKTSIQAKETPQIEKVIEENTPIANQVEANDAIVFPKEETAKVTKVEQTKRATVTKAAKSTKTPSESDVEPNEDNRIFAQASPTSKRNKEKNINTSILEQINSDNIENMGFAYSKPNIYPQNEYLEDAITNSMSKSSAVNIVIEKQEQNSFIKDRNGAIHIVYSGIIETKVKKSQYRFKVFTNDMDEYLDNIPKYQTHIETSRVEKGDSFKLDFKIDLPKGLYYYIIEEQVNEEYDMIYADKFIVE